MTNSARWRRRRSDWPNRLSCRADGPTQWETRTVKAVGSAAVLYVEAMESRVLLSAYALSEFGGFGVNASGANPKSTLVTDLSGNLYGTTSEGGPYSVGTVFEIAKGSSAITTLAAFNGANGAKPYGGVTLDGSGNLFGTTNQGGAYNEGTVFKIAYGSDGITTLASFNYSTTGANPFAGLTLDALGNLFGTTSVGGASSGGTVFEIASGSTALTTIVSFDSSIASDIDDGVTIDGSGNLYGTTHAGGAYGLGTVFEIAAASTTATTLASFNGADGRYPSEPVVVDASGDVYGTTWGAGGTDVGKVFEVATGSNAITTIASFDGTNGSYPLGGMTLDSSGDLYGSTSGGGGGNGGTVFEIAHGSNTITTLVSFDQSTGPSNPQAALILDASGNLYGTTYSGGSGGDGTVFEIANGSNAPSTLASFVGTNATTPYGGVALDASGNLYGTTFAGGTSGLGTLFEIANGSNTVSTLISFDGGNGSHPESTPTVDALGNVYGTTPSGGAFGDGTVYELARGSDTITTLASFSSSDGVYPAAGLTLDASGDLFGITDQGGASGDGTVFELHKGSSAITVRASLDSINSGQFTPGVSLDASGNIYGTTQEGGAYRYGRVFEIANGSSTLTTLASFNIANGQFPEGGVTLDPSGNLYGTTQQGGANADGTLFEIASGSNAITTLVSFKLGFQSDPGALSLDASGNLFGTTFDGTVFELAKGSTAVTTLASVGFGANPTPGLMIDSFGNLLGTIPAGGPGGAGTIFELAANSAVTLTRTNGSNPSTSSTPLKFTAAVSGFPYPQDGETVMLVDATNNDVVVATGTLKFGSATLSIPAGTLLAGTHNLIAVYGGDANFAASESAPYVQTVQVAVTGVTVNGNLPALAGAQRSMVDSIVYSFSEPVNLAATNAFSIALHSGQIGTVPMLDWAALNPNTDGSSSQWVVTFSGAGVSGGSIADGVYDITLNAGTVTSDANPSVSSQSRATDTFYRLFGDAQGTARVNSADYSAFLSTYGLKSTAAGYLGYFADDGTAKIDTSDYNAFLSNYGKKLSGFTATI